jgi:CheY-like chemotaxis protein
VKNRVRLAAASIYVAKTDTRRAAGQRRVACTVNVLDGLPPFLPMRRQPGGSLMQEWHGAAKRHDDGDRSSEDRRRTVPCVLIVEDDADVREFMNVLLSHSGFETVTATNGAEALQVVRERRPCLVLLDLMMPVMDGWTFRAKQLEDPAIADVPVVCLTALSEGQQLTERLHARCLKKPVEFGDLLDEVRRACIERQSRWRTGDGYAREDL